MKKTCALIFVGGTFFMPSLISRQKFPPRDPVSRWCPLWYTIPFEGVRGLIIIPSDTNHPPLFGGKAAERPIAVTPLFSFPVFCAVSTLCCGCFFHFGPRFFCDGEDGRKNAKPSSALTECNLTCAWKHLVRWGIYLKGYFNREVQQVCDLLSRPPTNPTATVAAIEVSWKKEIHLLNHFRNFMLRFSDTHTHKKSIVWDVLCVFSWSAYQSPGYRPSHWLLPLLNKLDRLKRKKNAPTGTRTRPVRTGSAIS